MKILAVSDRIEDRLYSPLLVQRFGEVELVLGCGDLPFPYLEYIVTSLNKPLLYVPGNHDPVYDPERPESYAEGCRNIDLQVVVERDLLIAGLGGSHRYRPDGVNQYTQAEMALRAARLARQVVWQRFSSRRRLDILVAHSPPAGIHDDTDVAHQGLVGLNWLLRWLRPKYLLHGHTHFYRHNISEYISRVRSTTVINVFPYRMIEV